MRVRPWIVTPEKPSASAARTSRGAVMCSSSQPKRSFSCTGRSVALFTASITSMARSGSFRSAEPLPLPTTFRAGQPMLMSMASKRPIAVSLRADSAIISGTLPISCAARGPSPGRRAIVSAKVGLRRFFARPSASDWIISVVAPSAPYSKQISRNDARVMPSIGASRNFAFSIVSPSRPAGNHRYTRSPFAAAA